MAKAAAVEEALARCDLVVLPRSDHPAMRVKSANRLERALWGGRMVVTTDAEVNDRWRDAAFVVEDIGAGVAMALADRTLWAERIRLGQERIANWRTAAPLAEAWEAAAREAGNGSPPGK